MVLMTRAPASGRVDRPFHTAARAKLARPERDAATVVSAKSLLGLVEVAVLLLQRQILPRPALVRGEPLGLLDALAEAPRRAAQRELGVDVDPARHVDGREEDVAELVEEPWVRLALGLGR